jgi:hypothetical protein
MQDYTPYQRIPMMNRAELFDLAAVRFEIHEAIADIKNLEMLRAILSRVRRTKEQNESTEEQST